MNSTISPKKILILLITFVRVLCLLIVSTITLSNDHIDEKYRKSFIIQTNDFIKKDLSLPFNIIRFIDLERDITFLQKNQFQLDITSKLSQIPILRCERSCFFQVTEIFSPSSTTKRERSKKYIISVQENIHEQQLSGDSNYSIPHKLFYFDLDSFSLLLLGEGFRPKFFVSNDNNNFDLLFLATTPLSLKYFSSKSIEKNTELNSLIKIDLKKASKARPFLITHSSILKNQEVIRPDITYPLSLKEINHSFFDYQFSENLGLIIIHPDPSSIFHFIVSTIIPDNQKNNLFIKKNIFTSSNFNFKDNPSIKSSYELLPLMTAEGLILLKKNICHIFNQKESNEKHRYESIIAFQNLSVVNNEFSSQLDGLIADFINEIRNSLSSSSNIANKDNKAIDRSTCLNIAIFHNPQRLEISIDSPRDFTQEKRQIVFLNKQISYIIPFDQKDYSSFYLWGNYLLRNNLFETFVFNLNNKGSSL